MDKKTLIHLQAELSALIFLKSFVYDIDEDEEDVLRDIEAAIGHLKNDMCFRIEQL